MSSSALRWRGLRSSSTPARPSRVMPLGPEVGHARGPEARRAVRGPRRGAGASRRSGAPRRAGMRAHAIGKVPLRDLHTLLVRQLAIQLGGHLGACGREPREALGGRVDQLLVAQRGGRRRRSAPRRRARRGRPGSARARRSARRRAPPPRPARARRGAAAPAAGAAAPRPGSGTRTTAAVSGSKGAGEPRSAAASPGRDLLPREGRLASRVPCAANKRPDNMS